MGPAIFYSSLHFIIKCISIVEELLHWT